MKIVHAYKIYLPDVNGGIPAVLSALTAPGGEQQHKIVVARRFGWSRKYLVNGIQVVAAASFGNMFSMPVAPTYPAVLLKNCDDADILLHHMPFPLTDFAIWIGLRRRTNLIVYWHAEVVGRSLLKVLVSPFIRYALKRADTIVVADESAARGSTLLAAHLSKLRVIPYGVDTHYWGNVGELEAIDIAQRRQKYPRLLITVGRLVHYKGFDILLRAVAETDVTVVIIGEGPLRIRLQQLSKELAIADRVIFAGNVPRDEIKSWMHAANLFVLPSRTIAEAFGIVQIEAMSAGTPVVNTRLATAVPLVARHQLEGLTVEPESTSELASAIRTLLDDPNYARKLGAAGRERALTEYDNSVFHRRISSLYDAVSRKTGD